MRMVLFHAATELRNSKASALASDFQLAQFFDFHSCFHKFFRKDAVVVPARLGRSPQQTVGPFDHLDERDAQDPVKVRA